MANHLNQSLQAAFQQTYSSLNTVQKQAVDSFEGPVMVIAGPGTGKTQILSARIAKILLDTDAKAENILCLTYTDAGVVAMRKRLLQFIGPDAYQVSIVTFHAFCNDVIQENLSLFEKHILDPVSDLERIELLKKLIDGFPKNHPLKRYRGNVYYEMSNLQSLFSTMKKEGWTPAQINASIDAYLNDLPNNEAYIYKRKFKNNNIGDLKQDKINEETERMEKLRVATDAFEAFQTIMRDANRYDFDDMINWVLQAFRENDALLRKYQEQYQYILVDEYQDTSGSQNSLVALLINYWGDSPNIFVVGDDDQSIYRFQGANIENMLNFAQTYSEQLKTLVLTQNYRSTQPILDVSKQLIDHNQERLVAQLPSLSKNLASSRAELKDLVRKPEIREYNSPREEMAAITLEVEKLLQSGLAPGKIGIIYKENKYGEELARYLQARNVPAYSKRSIDLLTLPLTNQLLLVLRYLAAEHDTSFGGDGYLFELLHIHWFKIPSIEIATLAAELADKNSSGGGPRLSLRQFLHQKALNPTLELFEDTPNGNLKKASRIIETLIAEVPNNTLQGVLEQIIREAGVLGWILKQPDKTWLMQVLTTFFDFVKEETRRNPLLKLEQLVNTLDTMVKEGLRIPMVQVSGTDKGVNLMTAHGSKGLEFDTVFLAGCNAHIWESKRSPNGGYKIPDTLVGSNSVDSTHAAEELRRLFYVALTRAEKQLYISYARYREDGKELEPSKFLAEIRNGYPLPVENPQLQPDELAAFAVVNFTAAAAPEIEHLETGFISRVLDRFTMNVTALSNFLKCPLEFYFRSLIRIPSPKNEATEFGSAVHHAVELLFRKMKDQQDKFPNLESFIADFIWYMNRHRESFTNEQFKRRLEYGKEILTNYYLQYIHNWNKVVAVERNIRNVLVDGVPIKGKLDKLEFDGKSVNVVDYKTGDPDNGIKKLKAPNDKEPNGGDYWRQAVFYKLLVDGDEKNDWKVISSEFDFIEPDKKKQYRKEKLVITDADMTTVKQQIKTVWTKIQAHDFYVGCGAKECHWCNFVKTNELQVSLHELNPHEE